MGDVVSLWNVPPHKCAGEDEFPQMSWFVGGVHGVACNLALRFAIIAPRCVVNMIRLAARSPKINEIAKELALLLAPMGHELVGIHVVE